jgi:hypothetical protein
MSTKTTIGTLDAFANARRLTTDVTRLAFQRRDRLAAPNPVVFPALGCTWLHLAAPACTASAKMRGMDPSWL